MKRYAEIHVRQMKRVFFEKRVQHPNGGSLFEEKKLIMYRIVETERL